MAERFMKRMAGIFEQYGERPAFVDSERTLTYARADEESAKIYSYLHNAGIGKEQYVVITLPRSAAIMTSIFGILKSGAAFVPLEDTYPRDRIEYIIRDVDAAAVIDEELYEKIMRTESPKPGYEETDLHDVAYVIYTSGSTGNPKGVIHEYGNIDQQADIIGELPYREEYREGLIAPFYFMAAFQFCVHYCLQARTVYIIPRDLVRNITVLSEYIEANRLQGIFLSPSYIRMYKTPSPYLEEILTAAEPANGIYYEGGKPRLRNLYGMTEGGFTILETILDRAYDVAPVGKPVLDIDAHLIDDDGSRIEGPGIGEFCFRAEYIRGYKNLPEKTAQMFVNGYCHTGDIVSRDKEGYYYIHGRKDDMFKINGNRIEPAEIEKQVKAITGLKQVVAKGFQTKERAFICVYFLREQARKLGILSGETLSCDMSGLKRMLPDYMIPTCYVALDAFPVSVNGKLAKLQLEAPDMSLFRREYVAPANDDEKFFCDVFSRILKVENVGVTDDFYLLGGDSLSSIRLVTECGENGYDVSFADIYDSRTPGRLAEKCPKRTVSDSVLSEMERNARNKAHSLLPGQQFHLIMKENASDSLTYNMSSLFRLKEDVDPERLKAAMDKALSAHPALSTGLEKTEQGTVQRYDSSLLKPTEMLSFSDEEFEEKKESLVVPMETYGSGFCRSAVIKTPSAAYMFIDIHHLVMDGTSQALLLNQIYDCYSDPDCELPADYYCLMLGDFDDEESRNRLRNEVEESVRAAGFDRDDLGRADILSPDLGGPDTGRSYLTDYKTFRKIGTEGPNLYLAACAMAVARMNGLNRALVYSTYNGRDKALKKDVFGNLATTIPIYLELDENDTPAAVLGRIRMQVEFGVPHGGWSYMAENAENLANTVLFNYQKDTLGIGKMSALVSNVLRTDIHPGSPAGIFTTGMIDSSQSDSLGFFCAYPDGFYSESAAKRYFELFRESVSWLLEEK
ncbi:MAG: AMP-binding protein [Eubacteriales bacterium]|nr:AMP-binding protein [Eubacteriales bacterium]